MNFENSVYHVFESNNQYYLLDTHKIICCQIEKNVYEALLNKDISLLTSDEVKLLDYFEQNNIFFSSNLQMDECEKNYEKVTISLAICHNCNLNCEYCFADSGENFIGSHRVFDKETAEVAIDFILTNEYFSKFSKVRINLVSGGEPLLNKQALFDFIRICNKKFKNSSKELYIWLSTNGTLLTEEDVIFFSKYNVGYGVSIDGDKENNNKLRYYKNGMGTYDSIVSNIKKIQSSNKVPRKYKELWGLMVYTKQNIDLLKNISHLNELGFSTVQTRFVRTDDKKLKLDETLAKTNILTFLDEIFFQAISGNDELLKLITNLHDYLGKLIYRVVTKTPYMSRCSAGYYMFSFAADGLIYPCDCFVGNSNFVMGNYYKSVNEEKIDYYSNLTVNKIAKCKKCWAKYICAGDCYHNSFVANGQLDQPDDEYCKLMLPIIECVVANVSKFEQNNKTQFEKFKEFIKRRVLFN